MESGKGEAKMPGYTDEQFQEMLKTLSVEQLQSMLERLRDNDAGAYQRLAHSQ
jgi:hypothetical protein